MEKNNQECKWLPFPDNKPRRNTLCLCKVKHRINAATDYRIAFYGEKPQCVCDNQFWLYDLIITNEVLAFMPLEQDYIYFK